ncbi:hypothetical protein GOBAR_DD07867 [Gossypium barbadense]|nr:hypothetical protein GOBAR_DD07867 [Gossypium barbadense]
MKVIADAGIDQGSENTSSETDRISRELNEKNSPAFYLEDDSIEDNILVSSAENMTSLVAGDDVAPIAGNDDDVALATGNDVVTVLKGKLMYFSLSNALYILYGIK